MSVENKLNSETITFGKYKNKTLNEVLKDRSYCKWLIKQDWFENNYNYLYKKVLEYDPLSYFVANNSNKTDFMSNFKFFNLKSSDNLEINITENEKICYDYYLIIINGLKEKTIESLETDKPYNIKAPCKWLQKFESEYNIPRTEFKRFLNSYELLNITSIIERIKKEGGIEYKGAQSFKIAKRRSLEQEKFWEDILKDVYNEDIGVQFLYEKCIFDFINIKLETIFECKLSLKDFDLNQYEKYKITLNKYKMVYLVGYDCIINMEKEIIYTTDYDKYNLYMSGLIGSSLELGKKDDKNLNDFTRIISKYKVEKIEELKEPLYK